MIAKANVISHGYNAVRYSVDKDDAEIVMTNYLPDDIPPSAMWMRMVMHQELCREKLNHHRKLENSSVRIEISPAKEETKDWTMADWRNLALEFVAEFDKPDLRHKNKNARKNEDGHTHLAHSQFVVSLHRDSEGQILHLHINANRVDMNGNVNNSYLIGKRATIAANKINERRGWVQSKQRRKENIEKITKDCMDILRNMAKFDWSTYERLIRQEGYGCKLVRDSNGKVRGYSVRKGHSTYKSSVLGHGRNLMASRIEKTWQQLQQDKSMHTEEYSLFGGFGSYSPKKSTHPEQKSKALLEAEAYLRRQEEEKARKEMQEKLEKKLQTPVVKQQPVMVHHDIEVDHKMYSVDIPKEANDVIMKSAEMPEDYLFTKIEDIQNTAILLFLNYVDAATTIADNCGGGGGTPESGWGKKDDEDEIDFARRCAEQSKVMHTRPQRKWHR